MTTLATADGRLLRAQGPRGSVAAGGSVFGGHPVGDPSLWAEYDTYPERWTSGAGELRAASYGALYAGQPVIAAVVNKLVRQMATTPLKTFAVDQDGDKRRIRADGDASGVGTRDAVARRREERLARLLERPAPRCGPVHLKTWMFWSPLVYGNGLVAKWHGDGPDEPPTELLPMMWRYVSAYAPNGGAVEVWGTTQVGAERFVAVDDTLHFAWGTDSELGVSPLKQLADTLYLEDAARRTQRASFANGMRPTAAVIPPAGAAWNEKWAAEQRRSLEAIHKGVDNQFRWAMLAPGADIKPLGFSSAEAELMTARRVNMLEACMVYDVKPPVVGALEEANYASIKEIHQELYRTTLRPWFTMAEETIKAHLIDGVRGWDGLFVEFDMGEQLKGDPLQVAQQLQAEIATGTLTPNEGRSIQNRPRDEHPDADRLYLPQNNLVALGGGPQDTPAAGLEAPSASSVGGAVPAAASASAAGQPPPPAGLPGPAAGGPKRIRVLRNDAGQVISYEREDD